jgi:transposase
MHITMGSVEVITSVQRRRRWSREEKQRIVAESARPDRTVLQVARTHGIAPNQLFGWRRQFLAAATAADTEASGFVAVRMIGEASVAAGRSMPSTGLSTAIEIRLPSGVAIGVGNDADVAALRRVLSVLWAG